ncbi:MAG: 4-hydroxythreonine-4-phosphate dehydrogenase [Gemmatimonadaceae bacterium]|jgi:4-hydroxythreonine-4-phosphate dehydrogenase|nr:4-hydroxythreonine-4-phosphate dehydrogenase [Gemmatimonadaceae bacterium]
MTVGDPRGIGPEVVAKALADPRVSERCDVVVIGPSGTEAQVTESIGSWPPGSDAALAGMLSGLAIEKAVRMAQAGEVDGIVTAPIDKSALLAGGYDYPGHTEMLGALTGSSVAMMLASDKLRVVLATTHIPLRSVVENLSAASIVEAARITREGLAAWFGIASPRIALCALNPHAGDGGRFGSEDTKLLEPAARAAGIDGPFPADTVFVRAMRGEFDAVIAPYHDVGMTAIKVASFGNAVNVTLGLPFPRTSPDHGTALDIAGQGRADPSSMIAATLLCASIVSRAQQSGGRPASADLPTDSRSSARPSRAR